ncbi:family 20 glycosylhydrolase [Flavobacteriaceae bacterium]|nr:family 20 glycosylhydrolase [Flavobacteriaceae bacterium]
MEPFPSLIPMPSKVEIIEGVFNIDENSSLYVGKEFFNAGEFLINYIEKGSTFKLKRSLEDKAAVVIKKSDTLSPEGYTLTVSDTRILINAKDASGAFYAIQTLRQLMPLQLEKNNGFQEKTISIPQVIIEDTPAFKYRGMHLDVGRHYFPKEFIKEYIAYMAMLKMNYFHWHLTEDQGWRIEIKQYPKLTEIGGFRNETLIGHYNDAPVTYDGTKYGGFYTQEDIKEIVAFAEKHEVTIIPEIEMPGHSQAAISAYPTLGCTSEQVEVAKTWGIFENIYCPNEDTFTFLENVLSEVIALFPGDYIHIGGDEAPKKQWKNCDHCQQLIKDLNLEDEHGLQSYFITRVEKFINTKGKKIIGWDEILEGGLAPNATVMSWRGIQGAIDAVKEGHDVILTPTSHTYFDYYQSNNENEPLAIGGFLPLKKVFRFNPIPPELNKEEEKFVLGAQGNVWTEYMKTEDQVEYMIFPRILAMSEVVWRGPIKNFEDDYPDFLKRTEVFNERLKELEINYANHLYEIEGAIINEKGELKYQLSTPISGKEIRYTMDGSKVNTSSKLYNQGIIINDNTTIQAGVFKDNQLVSSIFSEIINYHKAVKGSVTINPTPHTSYNAGGNQALINGILGSDKRYGDKEWLGFWRDDVEININLNEETTINSITTRFYNTNGQWIYAPKKIDIAYSLDGKKYYLLKEVELSSTDRIVKITAEFDAVNTKYIKILAPNYGVIPEGKQGAGNKAWIFIDEIIVE